MDHSFVFYLMFSASSFLMLKNKIHYFVAKLGAIIKFYSITLSLYYYTIMFKFFISLQFKRNSESFL
jgi:hypothetical protein